MFVLHGFRDDATPLFLVSASSSGNAEEDAMPTLANVASGSHLPRPDDKRTYEIPPRPEIYPVYAHPVHPLHNAWIKLPASLIQKLYIPRGFEASNTSRLGPALPLFHYTNHPVSFVHICGVVVGLDFSDFWDAWIIQVDDGSGFILQALCRKAREEDLANAPHRAGGKLARHGELIKPLLPDWKGRGWTGYEEVDTRVVQVGKVLRVKGKIREWKGRKQVLAERVFPVSTTAEEAQFWQAMCDNFKTLLCKPWTLSNEEVKLCRERAGRTREMHRKRKKVQKERAEREAISTEQRVCEANNPSNGCKCEPEPKPGGRQEDARERLSQNITNDKDFEEARTCQEEGEFLCGRDDAGPPEIPSDMRGFLLEESVGDKTMDEQDIIAASDKASIKKPLAATPDHVPVNATPSSSPSSSLNRFDAAQESLQNEGTGAITISRGSSHHCDDLELEPESSNEPPPGNQLALKQPTSTSSEKLSNVKHANFEMSSAASTPKILNAGLPYQWEQLDGLISLADSHVNILDGLEWIEFRRRNGAETDDLSLKTQTSTASTKTDYIANCSSAKPPLSHRAHNSRSLYNWEDEWERIEL